MKTPWAWVGVLVVVGCAPAHPDEKTGKPAACAPETCTSLGMVCGAAKDGCGGTLDCGPCSAACVARTCQELGVACGTADDGCGGTLECGACACTPRTCAEAGVTCGTADDGCGGILDCGACDCAPATCEQLGATCGDPSDGCGRRLDCGGCPAETPCGGAFTYACERCQVRADLGSALPVVVYDDHTGEWDGYAAWPALPFAAGQAYVTYRWTAPRTATYVISPLGTGDGSAVVVRKDTCAGPTVELNHDRVSLQAGETLYATVFGTNMMIASVSDEYRVSISEYAPAEQPGASCGNRLDDDGDRLLDCEDPDCAASAECGGPACADVDLGAQANVSHSAAQLPKPGPFIQGKPYVRTYLWTAPHRGRYRFDAGMTDLGAGFLVLRDSCTGPVVAMGPERYGPALTLELEAGRRLVISMGGPDELPSHFRVTAPDTIEIHEEL